MQSPARAEKMPGYCSTKEGLRQNCFAKAQVKHVHEVLKALFSAQLLKPWRVKKGGLVRTLGQVFDGPGQLNQHGVGSGDGEGEQV